jgi:protein gp37
MAKNSAIEWCHHTVNFWWGCVFALLLDGSLDEACRNCYAKMLAALFSRGKATWGPKGNRWIRHLAAVRELAKLDESARKRNVRERVFINSMSDTFEDRDDLNEARAALFAVSQVVTNLDILLLTKRPQNVRRMVPAAWLENWPAHVWIGTTCGTQQAADERVPELLSIPARVRFLSCEPLLGPVNLERVEFGPRPNHTPQSCLTPTYMGRFDAKIHWVICGGESGPKARPMHPEWARSLRDQCQAAGVAFFFKQWGEWLPDCQRRFTTSGEITWGLVHASGGFRQTLNKGKRDWAQDPAWEPGEEGCTKVGKKAAGRQLDGREHNEFPEVRA